MGPSLRQASQAVAGHSVYELAKVAGGLVITSGKSLLLNVNPTEAEMHSIKSMSRLEKPHDNTVSFRRKLPPYTASIAKLVGIYVTVISVVLIAGKGSSIEMMSSIVRNRELLFILAILGMTAGLAILLVHNVWSGGALPVMVTLVGWTAALKGIILMVLAVMGHGSAVLDALQYGRFFYVYMGLAALLGLYLAISGFRSGAQEPRGQL